MTRDDVVVIVELNQLGRSESFIIVSHNLSRTPIAVRGTIHSSIEEKTQTTITEINTYFGPIDQLLCIT